MYDFIHIVKFLFKDKDQYSKLSNEDKKKFFFIVNRRISRSFPHHAQFFNNENIDQSSALDIWYQFFIKKRTNGIPTWFQFKNPKKKDKSIIKNEEKEYLMGLYNISEKDVDFLEKFYLDELKIELKKIRKIKK